MDAFEFDMNFDPVALAAEIERFFTERGWEWSRACATSDDCTYNVTLSSGQSVVVRVRPLPAERLNYIGMLPRALVEARAATGSDITALRRDFLLAFLRVMG